MKIVYVSLSLKELTELSKAFGSAASMVADLKDFDIFKPSKKVEK